MNPNTEYERFTQEIYQQLVNLDVRWKTEVQHNVKLEGRSGQKHQIDVYWEYEIAGNKQRVAIECKNYNKLVPIGKVRDFKGVLDDLNGVNGIMVTKVGYQDGARRYAQEYGISIKELRTPGYGESIIGEIGFTMYLNVRHTLFLVDEEWAAEKGLNLVGYRKFLSATRMHNDGKWTEATYIPLQTDEDTIRDSSGNAISSLKELEEQVPDVEDGDNPVTFPFLDAYINVHGVGPVKIKEVRYEYENTVEERRIALDAEGFVKAILKDAITGSTTIL